MSKVQTTVSLPKPVSMKDLSLGIIEMGLDAETAQILGVKDLGDELVVEIVAGRINNFNPAGDSPASEALRGAGNIGAV